MYVDNTDMAKVQARKDWPFVDREERLKAKYGCASQRTSPSPGLEGFVTRHVLTMVVISLLIASPWRGPRREKEPVPVAHRCTAFSAR